MTLLQRGRTAAKDPATDSGRTLANLNAADYLGALIGGLLWPFALLPHLGMIRGAAATGDRQPGRRGRRVDLSCCGTSFRCGSW